MDRWVGWDETVLSNEMINYLFIDRNPIDIIRNKILFVQIRWIIKFDLTGDV